MRLVQQLKTLPLFINYFLKVVDEHSIQAPFAFKFYHDLVKAIKSSVGDEDIEKAREAFKNDHSMVHGQDLGAGSRISKVSRISGIARLGISSKKDCLFVRELAKILKSHVCVELGTSLGIGTAYLAKSEFVNKIYSFEGNKQLVDISSQLIQKVKAENVQIIHGNIDHQLPDFLQKNQHVDLAIIDANHTEKALLNYFNLLYPKMHTNGAMVIDDIRWSGEMYNGWNKIIAKNEVSISMEFLNKGLIFFEKGMQKQHYILSI